MKSYGIELIIDMQNCDTSKFTKKEISNYFVELCDLIDMKRHGAPMFWEDGGSDPKLNGISAVQFIQTSNIVIHTLRTLNKVFVNIFSCKKFDKKLAKNFTKNYFKAKKIKTTLIERK